MHGFEAEHVGSAPLFVGASKPRLFWGCDPRLFIPIGLVVAIGVLFFGTRLPMLGLCFGFAGLIFFAGKIMGRWSPYFIDEFLRWVSWRFRTGSGPLVADATFYAITSPETKRWRPR